MKFKVLIPVDSLRNSISAEEYALRLNWRLSLSVTLVNVLNTKRLQGRGISPADQERIVGAMRKRAEEVLEAAAEPFKKADAEYLTRVEEGDPGPLICRLAEEEQFEMVIIPQSGLSELEEILGGSVVRTVLNHCKVPVLVIKHTDEHLHKVRAQKS